MASISEVFSTGQITLSGTTADSVVLSAKGTHKVLITNVTGATTLHVNVSDITDAVKSQGKLTMDTKPVGLVAAQGKLTIDTQVSGGVKAAGTLSIDEPVSGGVKAAGTLTIKEPVTDGDTYTLDSKVYTLETSLSDVDGNVAIGGSEAQTKLNIVKAIDLSGTAGVDYATSMTAHPTVTMAAFSNDDAVVTAKAVGTAGNSIVSTETFTHVNNVFDASTLGTTTTGVEADTYTLDSKVYKLQAVLTNVDGNVAIGGSEAQTKLNIVAAINLSGTAGTDYATLMTAHTSVTMAAFSGDDAVVTASAVGTAGNSITSTETFADGANIFDASTLGTTTSGVQPDTFTIGARTYTLQDTLTNVDGNIKIGSNEANTKLNIIAAINHPIGTRQSGTDYAAAMTENTEVSIAAFSGDDAIITADAAGVASDALTSTETFAAGGSVFDASTLGATRAGTTADTLTIGANVYTFTTSLDSSDAANTVFIGADLAAAKVNLVAAIAGAAGAADTKFSQATKVHPTVTVATFSGNDMTITAITAGVAGDLIVSTETFSASGNVFDAATLGTTTAGVARVAVTATAAADHLLVPTGLTLDLMSNAYDVDTDGLIASVVGNGNVYIVQLLS